MNRYTVVYLSEAEDNLIATWSDASDRDAVTKAANSADLHFASTPQQVAVEIGEGLMRFDVPPLRFYFEIREDDRIVEISNVVLIDD